MIFVTVGTHEQPFNRLIKEMDRLKGTDIIKDEVIMQTGYCTYEPQYCKYQKLLPYAKMEEYVKDADIIITHGGPSSFMMPLQVGKIPIVVPRQKQYGEHINDHQVEFAEAVKERYENIIVIKNIVNLKKAIMNYEHICMSMHAKAENNNLKFNKILGEIVNEIF